MHDVFSGYDLFSLLKFFLSISRAFRNMLWFIGAMGFLDHQS